ncbi:hypothetical protein ACWGJP_15450 [Microbacterium sp. NPDC055903]
MSRIMGHWDRAESQEQIDEATAVLLQLRAHLKELDAPAPPMPGSMLATEDALTSREPLSTLVRGMRNRALDGLDMFMDATVHEERELMWARPIAPYALLRMSVEALGVGRWLVLHSHKNERVMRALRLSLDHAQDAHEFASLMAEPSDREALLKRHRDVVARLHQLKDSVGALRQRSLTGLPSYTDIQRAVSPPVPPGASHEVNSPFFVWKLCSGILHGNSSVMRAVSDIEQLSEWEGGMAEFRMTPKWGLLSGALFTCMRELRTLDERTTFLGTHDYAERPITATST